ncbi:hypothetical protein NXC14_PA00273 (plasmid) [Rhizobium sp. NXC14]|nr:hypothetical protein NXC14_PA00273 [Rhizobium sp. NXC14]
MQRPPCSFFLLLFEDRIMGPKQRSVRCVPDTVTRGSRYWPSEMIDLSTVLAPEVTNLLNTSDLPEPLAICVDLLVW